jgi:hypothetical protein
MAIVYSYPQGTPTLSDMVLGTQFDYDGNPTKSFLISDIIGLVPAPAIPTLQEVCNAGAIVLNTPIILESNNYTLQVQSEAQIAVIGQGPEVAGVKGSTDIGYGVWGIAQSGYGGYFSSDENYSLVAAQSAAKPGGGSWSAYSDSRIKENIIPYTKGLSDILLINPVTYEYNGLAGTTKGKKYTGIIAQEIKEVFPDTVNTYKAKLNEEDKEKTELYDFNSSDLTFALINAIKELKAEIDLLKTK